MKQLKVFLFGGICSVGLWACNDTPEATDTESTVTTSTMNESTAEVDNTSVDMDTAMVPTTVRSSFTTKYSDANNTRWSRYKPEDDGYRDTYQEEQLDTSVFQVDYRYKDNDYRAWYDTQGQWIGTMYYIPVEQVPTDVKSAVEKAYSGYNIVKVGEEEYKGGKKYDIKLEKGDEKIKIHVTSSGEILKYKEKS